MNVVSRKPADGTAAVAASRCRRARRALLAAATAAASALTLLATGPGAASAAAPFRFQIDAGFRAAQPPMTAWFT